ncbi:hypothetical protein BTJ49_11695 [Oleiagrimonas sp. MCCC 1A03011]|nr:hypothetical protein BTJ49_11695 [Oleiagrimonas sp. MCCC 1A03011]
MQVVTARATSPRPFDLPASVDLIDLTGPGRDVPGIGARQALRGVPGLFVGERQNLAQDAPVSIRGFGARAAFGIRGVRLVVDGIPATSPDGQGQLSNAMFGAAERIEVLRGPFAALYANAAGGLIRVITAAGDTPARQRVEVGGGSHGTGHAEVGASGRAGSIGYNFNLDRTHIDGQRGHARADRSGADLRLDWRRSTRQRWTLAMNVFDQPRAQDPQSLTRAQFRADPQQAAPSALAYNTRKRVRQTQAGLTLHQAIGTHQAVRATAYAGRRAVRQYLSVPVFVQASPFSAGGVIDLDGGFHGVDLRWQWCSRALGRPLSVTAGLNDEVEDVHRRGYDNFVGDVLGVRGTLRRDEHDIVVSRGLYVLGTLRPAPRWSVSAGLRRSQVRFRVRDGFVNAVNPDDSGRITYAATTPVVGLLFRLRRDWHVYASWGRAFETPTVAELAYRADGSAGLNLALNPARTSQLELGAKWRGRGGARFDLALFAAATADTLGVDRSSGGRTTYHNIGTSRRRGVELSARWPLVRHWRLGLAATALTAKVRQSDGRRALLPGVPRQRLQLGLDWSGAHGWRAGLQAEALSAVPVGDADSQRAPGYALLGAHVGRTWSFGEVELTAFARLDNIFGRRYVGAVVVNQAQGRFYEAGPGRAVFVGLRLAHGGGDEAATH